MLRNSGRNIQEPPRKLAPPRSKKPGTERTIKKGLYEQPHVPPSGLTKWVPTVVKDVRANAIVRWENEFGVLSTFNPNGSRGRRFESWEGPPVQLMPHEVVDVLVLSDRAARRHKQSVR